MFSSSGCSHSSRRNTLLGQLLVPSAENQQKCIFFWKQVLIQSQIALDHEHVNMFRWFRVYDLQCVLLVLGCSFKLATDWVILGSSSWQCWSDGLSWDHAMRDTFSIHHIVSLAKRADLKPGFWMLLTNDERCIVKGSFMEETPSYGLSHSH